ncbi:hypothetical protein GTA08_BOTSDO12767 [Neofusicoccum parvum]|uniref:Uncharacterized protein n=2 Tax=Neofusicoccum parvum TaxID=310453 RepID=A0ACB5S8E5_9PEZI|nr:putative duf803 domain membrane protein [Neofusicoccum parvum UCRNP2]GME28977.1 hypothetical protein GTA08_BOTSDO12767 [Neofusicoccum parvum]GME41362.1 hypothetical protein GTA08_BOTSDO12767 [Neofusicoccum parvum]
MDVAGDALLASHELYARSGVSTGDSSEKPAVYKVVGIILALSSGLFIGVSFVIKKKGLLSANEKYSEEAGEGYGYLKNWMWWTGMTLMIIGEVCNFVAYAFVDAILVTPMGALSVVVTAILSAIFLKERLSFVGKVGCFLCIVGSVIIVINAPEQSSVSTIQEMKKLVVTPGFLSYTGVVILISLFLAFWVAPRYAKKSMMVYISICTQFNQWFLYVVLVFVIATLLTEIIYLNKALNIFNAALVTPTYYVFFTSATIVTSAILFQGFKGTGTTISTVVMGFLVICSGVVLLQLSKSAKDVPDAAVFKGDLDQVRTVAEQEEPDGIHWASNIDERVRSPGSTLTPPAPPPHASGSSSSNKRQFSFTNVFTRASRSDSTGSNDLRPVSARSGLSFAHRKPAAATTTSPSETEEERLGLVKGDSRFDNDNDSAQPSGASSHLPRISSDSDTDGDAFYGRYGSPPTYSDLKDDVEDPELGVLSDEERWTVPMPSGIRGTGPTSGGSAGHSRNLTGGGLGSAPVDVRIPSPGVPSGPGVGSSRGQELGSPGRGGYAHARNTSDSSDDFMEAVRKL